MAAGVDGGVKEATASQAYLEGKAVKETRALIAELCRHFYNLGWVSGTGGSITIKVHDDSIPKPHQLVIMSPSGISIKLEKFHVYELLTQFLNFHVTFFVDWLVDLCAFV